MNREVVKVAELQRQNLHMRVTNLEDASGRLNVDKDKNDMPLQEAAEAKGN